jgi:hypothetical protein
MCFKTKFLQFYDSMTLNDIVPIIRFVSKQPIQEFQLLLLKLDIFLSHNQDKVLESLRRNPKASGELENVIMLLEGSLYIEKY